MEITETLEELLVEVTEIEITVKKIIAVRTSLIAILEEARAIAAATRAKAEPEVVGKKKLKWYGNVLGFDKE